MTIISAYRHVENIHSWVVCLISSFTTSFTPSLRCLRCLRCLLNNRRCLLNNRRCLLNNRRWNNRRWNNRWNSARTGVRKSRSKCLCEVHQYIETQVPVTKKICQNIEAYGIHGEFSRFVLDRLFTFRQAVDVERVRVFRFTLLGGHLAGLPS